VDTTGKRKPSPEAFLYALEKLNVKPEEAIFVGDDLERDYQGAQRIGMRAIMINRKGKPIADVKSITSLRQILDFL
jgi:putative hydrolase of the HAD superfamily